MGLRLKTAIKFNDSVLKYRLSYYNNIFLRNYDSGADHSGETIVQMAVLPVLTATQCTSS